MFLEIAFPFLGCVVYRNPEKCVGGDRRLVEVDVGDEGHNKCVISLWGDQCDMELEQGDVSLTAFMRRRLKNTEDMCNWSWRFTLQELYMVELFLPENIIKQIGNKRLHKIS